ncbi:MAG: PAS domain-containing protein, partial [Planctomycetota bacterium]
MESVLSLFEQTTDGVCAIDWQQRIVMWNGAAAGMFGCPARDVLGRRCFNVLKCTDEAGRCFCRRDCPTIRAIRASDVVPTRTLESHPEHGDPRWLSVTTLLMPRRWQDAAALVHLFRDVGRAKTVVDAVERLVANVVHPDAAAADGQDPGLAARSPGPPNRGALLPLTPRERVVLRHLATGLST